MKNIIIGAAAFIQSFLFLFQMGLVAMIFRPEWFAPSIHREPPTEVISESDTVGHVGADSVKGERQGKEVVHAGIPAGPSQDSLATAMEARLIERGAMVEVQNSGAEATGNIPPAHPIIDSVKAAEVRSKSRIIEAMDPESAAKILGNLQDEDVKMILLAIKKRQAGKILGSMDPDRASRILR